MDNNKQQIRNAAMMAAAPGVAIPLQMMQAKKDSKEQERLQKKQEELLNKQSREEDAKLKTLREGGRAIGGGGNENTAEGFSVSWLSVIFWSAVFIQLLDLLTGSQRPGLILTLYTILVIISIIFVFKRDRIDEIGLTIAVVAAYFLPWLTKASFIVNAASSSKFTLLITGLIVLLPVVPLYIAFKFPDHSKIRLWAQWVITFWVIIFALYIVTAYMPAQNSVTLINNPMAGVKFVLSGAWNTIKDAESSITKTVKQAIAQATGQPYEGQEESQVGIYVENVNPLESRYSNMSDVIVTAKIKAVNVKEPVKVNVLCYIEGLKQGDVNPSYISDVVGDYENSVECRLGKLGVGSYTVKVRANFEFESTSDITYTFVSTNIRAEQYVQLNINPQTIATYTGGPVELGLPSLSQPLRIELDSDKMQSSYPFGVSLQSKWPQGKVVRGLKYVLNTPKEVKLVECTRDPITSVEPESDTDRNKYEFSIDTNNAQEVFDAVRCRMKFENLNDLLGNDLKSMKTFAASAKYEYAVEGSTYLVIEKS